MWAAGENRGWGKHACLTLAVLLVAGAACTEPNGAYRRARTFDTGVNPGMDAGVEAPISPRDADEPADTVPPPADAPPPPEDQAADAELDAAEYPDVPPVDLAPDVSPPADLPPDMLPAGCGGSLTIDVSSISSTDGIAIAPDGTIYFSHDDGTVGLVGRVRPPSGGQPPVIERRYIAIPSSLFTSGVALNRAGTRLYVAAVTGQAVLVYDLTVASPTMSTLIAPVDSINDLALDAAGTLYYSRQSDRNVYAVVDGTPVKVTTTTIGAVAQDQSPAALVFAPDGALFVGMRKGGRIFRLEIVNHQERGRVAWSDLSVWANGLAVDDQGGLHVGVYSETGNGRVVVIGPDGSTYSDVVTDGRFASMAFGRGALDCQDLYVTSPNGPMRRLHHPRRGYHHP